MVKFFPISHLQKLAMGSVILVWSLGCSGNLKPSSGGTGDPIPIPLTLSSIPTLITNPQDRWIVTVNQQVQFHAIDPRTGQKVDDKVLWVVSGYIRESDPVGTIDQTGKYAAPPLPTTIVLSVGTLPNVLLYYQGGKYIDIVAAPRITGFTATPSTINFGQSTTLTPSFESGQGQLLVGTQVIQTGLISGTPVTVSPTATTIYTLQVTNAAGAFVTLDLNINVS